MANALLRKSKELCFRAATILSSDYFTLFLILILGVFLRFKGLNLQSLWFDELFSVTNAAPSLSFSNIVTTFQTDPHPPLFFLGLHYWMTLFGYTDVAARALVATIGSISVVSIYWLGRECLDKKTGLVAALFTSINYYNIEFSQEVRPYILLFLFTTLSYASFIRLIRKQDRTNVIIYSMLTAAMMYSHYYGLIHLLSQCIFLLFYLVLENNIHRQLLLKHFVSSGVLITLLYSPWIPTTLKMLKLSSHWTGKPEPNFFLNLFNRFFVSPYLVTLFGGLILILLLFLVSIRKKESSLSKEVQSPEDAAAERLSLAIPVLFSWVFFTLFIPYFRSLLTIWMYFHKYAIGTLPAMIVMVSISIMLFKSTIFRALLITSVLLVSMTTLFLERDYYRPIRKQDWRGSLNYVLETSDRIHPAGGIYLLTVHSSMYQFYLDSMKRTSENIHFLPNDAEQVERILGSRAKDDIIVWALPGHTSEPSRKAIAFIRQNFEEVLKKDAGMGNIVLFIPRTEKEGRDGSSTSPR